MNKNIIIRRYHSADKTAVLALLKLNIPDYFAENELRDFDEYLENKVEQYFIIELGGHIIGAGGMNIELTTQTGIISWDVIHPEFQRKGIGRQLLSHRIELFLSIPTIEVIKVRTSQLTYLFYEKNNFTLKEIVADYWAKGYDLYDMEFKKP